jgi:uncharacterized membrane protein
MRAEYLGVKWLHLLGAAVLFGTGWASPSSPGSATGGGCEQGDIGLIRGVLAPHGAGGHRRSPRRAAMRQPVTGCVLWRMTAATWPDRWLAGCWRCTLFVGACWLPVVAAAGPLRDAAAQAATVGDSTPASIARFALVRAGWPASLGVLGLFALMLARGPFADHATLRPVVQRARRDHFHQREGGGPGALLRRGAGARRGLGGLLPRGGKPRQVVKTASLVGLACHLAQIDPWLFDECYQSVGDLAETIALVLPRGDAPSDVGLAEWVEGPPAAAARACRTRRSRSASRGTGANWTRSGASC